MQVDSATDAFDAQVRAVLERKRGECAVAGVLGEGAWGRVYRVRHGLLEQDRALKVSRLRGSVHAEAFLREAKLAARLDHPNIARVFDTFVEDGHAFLFLEYLSGRTLEEAREAPQDWPARERVLDADGQFRAEFLRRMALQVALALAHAHGQGILHLDIKPSNLFVTDDLQVKLLDFSISHDASAEPVLRLSAAPKPLIGSAAWMSPEQIRGGALDGRSDVYSLGCVLYWGLTGRVAHQGDSAEEVCLRRLRESPDALRPDAPEGLGALVLRMLSPEPEERPTALEAHRELLLLGSLARNEGKSQTARRRGRRLAVAALAAGLLPAVWLLSNPKAAVQAASAPPTERDWAAPEQMAVVRRAVTRLEEQQRWRERVAASLQGGARVVELDHAAAPSLVLEEGGAVRLRIRNTAAVPLRFDLWMPRARLAALTLQGAQGGLPETKLHRLPELDTASLSSEDRTLGPGEEQSFHLMTLPPLEAQAFLYRLDLHAEDCYFLWIDAGAAASSTTPLEAGLGPTEAVSARQVAGVRSPFHVERALAESGAQARAFADWYDTLSTPRDTASSGTLAALPLDSRRENLRAFLDFAATTAREGRALPAEQWTLADCHADATDGAVELTFRAATQRTVDLRVYLLDGTQEGQSLAGYDPAEVPVPFERPLAGHLLAADHLRPWDQQLGVRLLLPPVPLEGSRRHLPPADGATPRVVALVAAATREPDPAAPPFPEIAALASDTPKPVSNPAPMEVSSR